MFLTLKKKLSADCFIALIVTIESDLYPSREVPNATEALFFFFIQEMEPVLPLNGIDCLSFSRHYTTPLGLVLPHNKFDINKLQLFKKI